MYGCVTAFLCGHSACERGAELLEALGIVAAFALAFAVKQEDAGEVPGDVAVE